MPERPIEPPFISDEIRALPLEGENHFGHVYVILNGEPHRVSTVGEAIDAYLGRMTDA